jgi:predicted DNA-binding transcriptional regulator YafY
VLSWGGAVEVLEPPELRDAIAASVSRAAARYAG